MTSSDIAVNILFKHNYETILKFMIDKAFFLYTRTIHLHS